MSKAYDIGSLFREQLMFQELLGFRVPTDDPEMLAHNAIGLVTEIGEVMQADKRWKKNKRNTHYDRDEKLSEFADVTIFLINMCLYSNITAKDLHEAVLKKINTNKQRYLKED